ncbi:DNA cytosine methyltransferase [uncultured Dubosiella sp.]|uniref:DNA cytosine methyltransferase n=1 Tax=uncultured Dubosiella sp. TaxID=1937011 RepID=UPI0027307C2C|nr:DNA (cytosine-5-)-methyltransferase [uncultured Dubosiella sp.]
MNEQMNIFQVMYPRFKISNKIRLIELFAGIGSQAMALRDLGVSFEHYRVVEFDKNAIASYNAIHRTDFSPMDITRVHANDLDIKNLDIFTYIMTYSFPCQDLSLAGNKKGMKKGSGTRSGLLWEVERILDEILAGEAGLPQVLLMENVPQILNSRNIEDFRSWQNKLESLGYKNYTQVLNAKDYGVPQNRKRCFMVSILGNYWFEFPHSTVLKIHLRDLLEDNVPEKYYLSESAIKTFTDSSDRGGVYSCQTFPSAESGITRLCLRDNNQVR